MCVRPIGHVQTSAFPVQDQACICDHAAPCHRIEYQIPLIGEVTEGMCDHLSRDPSPPIVTETSVAMK